MSLVTPGQLAKTIKLIADSGINSATYQSLLQSGRLSRLLQEFKSRPAPTINYFSLPLDYNRTLVQMRDATKCDGLISSKFNDENFAVELAKNGIRELALICFNRRISDDEDPEKSELLWELNELGLKLERAPELCAVGEHCPDLQREFPIVGRGQVWRNEYGSLMCPVLTVDGNHKRGISLSQIGTGWFDFHRFLVSRK